MGTSRIGFSTRWAAAWSAIRCFGTQLSPRAGVSFYAVRPRKSVLSERDPFNFGDAVREPALTDQFGSLYAFWCECTSPWAQQLNIGPWPRPP